MAAVVEDVETPSKHPIEDSGQSGAKRQKVLLEDDADETKTKAKAKKMAMCMTYNGKGYLGMQRNPGAKTIEEDLFQAMYRARLLSQDQLDSPQSIMFQRAARTDKGVSAVRQVVSLKLPTNIPAETMVDNINNELGDNIRVIGIKRTTRGFNSKNNCDARTYSYILPSFAFAHPNVAASIEYRISGERLEEANRILSLYKGCHNFHNFTSGKKPEDPSAMRYIITCECSKPFEQRGLEFVQIQLKGQSFMLHQIRKMVALVIAIMRGYTSESTIRRAWGPEKLDIPIAPALGLMLEEVHYERYNQKYRGDGLHEPLTWTEKQDIIHTFKEMHIYPTIVETEDREQSMLSWMESLQMHTYDIREAGPPSVVAVNKNHEMEDDTRAGDVNGCNTLEDGKS
ncbi:pseudouridylate synthase 1 homolog isoform X2 [Ornithodoros turicata]